MLDVAIIGAGLAGLSLAGRLRHAGLSLAVFEARDRPGGRILSLPPSAAQTKSGPRFDLGPSWIWPEHQPHLAELVRRASLDVYPQWQQGTSLYMADREAPPQTYVDENAYADAYRVDGGTQRMVEVLLGELRAGDVQLGHRLCEVIERDAHVALRFSTAGGTLNVEAKRVVLTLPPRLIAASIAFSPALDAALLETMRDTPTWMASHAKAVVCYEHAFWRAASFSGNGFAIYPGAALREIFDASSSDGRFAALSGFFALPAAMRSRYRDDLEALVLDQLVRMFGPSAARPQKILFKDWADDDLTATPEDHVPLDAHPPYGHPWLQRDHWNDKLHFGGTETAQQFGGYLEGALESAARIARTLSLS